MLDPKDYDQMWREAFKMALKVATLEQAEDVLRILDVLEKKSNMPRLQDPRERMRVVVAYIASRVAMADAENASDLVAAIANVLTAVGGPGATVVAIPMPGSGDLPTVPKSILDRAAKGPLN